MTTKLAMTIASLCLATLGGLLLIMPDEVSTTLTSASSGGAIAQMCGAAMIGFAAMNWTARGSALGGIYGRAVVVGNQTHLMVGALLLISGGMAASRHPAYWVVTGLYICGALYFSYLTFFSS